MRYKIVSDSSSDLTEVQGTAFSSVPLKIITSEKEYVDEPSLDVAEMVTDLQKYKGTSKSSCPNSEEWKTSFEDYDGVFCVTITSGLSGSANSASLAVKQYTEGNPEKQAHVVDTLSTGPESALIIEKLQELISAKLDFENIKKEIEKYKNNTHLIFALESLKNLANNGRVSMAVAKIAGVLGIRVVGRASLQGTLEISSKVRGYAKTLTEIFKNMINTGYIGEKVRIHHCQNEKAAKELAEMIKSKFPKAVIKIQETRALCSFYAEAGGLLVGYEGGAKV